MAKASSSNATTPVAASAALPLSATAAAWLNAERRIGAATLAKLPVASGTAFFPELEEKSEAVFFEYPNGWKARSFPEKSFTQKKGTAQTFWNLEAVLSRSKIDRVFIVEGELDACALVEAGIDPREVLSTPSGSGDQLQYVRDALAGGLSRAAKFVLCGDSDEVGLEIRHKLARILGIARTSFVEWPEGCKDANDHLRSEGAEALLDLVTEGQVLWPTNGLFRMSEIPEEKPMTIWDPGFDGWHDRLRLSAGTLSVVTGHPGMGKTILWAQIWYQVIKRYELTAAVASFETRAKPHMRRQLRTLICGRLESTLEQYEIAQADSWIENHYLFLVHPERRPDLQWLLEQAETAVIRYGAKVVQIDPWNRLEASRAAGESETDYIGRCLRELYNFAVDLNCHVQILAHPAKSDGHRIGMPPELEHIAGSKNWDNMVDQGFVVHRPRMFNESGERQTYCELHHKKARFDELGYATKLGLDFDIGVGRFGVCNLRKKHKAVVKEPPEEDE